jgi:hypothetical protein
MSRTRSTNDALRSLASVEVLAALTSVHHLDELGVIFLGPALLITILPLILSWLWTRNPSQPLLWGYGIYLALLILGFGFYDGFWNHTVKMTIFFLQGADRRLMANAYPYFPPVGSIFHEVTGALTFIVALYAAYFGFRFFASNLNKASRNGALPSRKRAS